MIPFIVKIKQEAKLFKYSLSLIYDKDNPKENLYCFKNNPQVLTEILSIISDLLLNEVKEIVIKREV